MLRSALPGAMVVTVWLLAGCAPGSGGTGAPANGAGSPDASSAASSPAPAPAPAPVSLPSTPPQLEGTIDALDAVTVVVAGTGLTRATLRIVLADGSDAPAATVVIGARLRIWTVTGGQLALLLQ